MDNPYRVSEAAARSADAPSRRPFIAIVAVIEVLVGLAAATLAPTIVSSFEEVLKGFGADLPALTRFVLATRYGWWLFAVAAVWILVWILRRPAPTPVKQRRQMLAVVGYAIALGVACGVALISLYLPIFRLGATV